MTYYIQKIIVLVMFGCIKLLIISGAKVRTFRNDEEMFIAIKETDG